MTRPLLNRFVRGARQVLALQLLLAIGLVAIAGWTLGVTSELMRERESMRSRIAQLEETLVGHDIVVPSTATVVESTAAQRARDVYPPAAPAEAQIAASEDSAFNPTQIIGDLFTPPPAMRVVIVHVRNAAEARIAAQLTAELARNASVEAFVSIMPAREQRPAGYSYFDGRQSGAAAALLQIFHETARRIGVAPWSAQLRGVALPAQGQYTPDRLDIVLPALSPAQTQRLDPAPPEPVVDTPELPTPVNR